MMIEGALNSTSLMKRMTVLRRELRPYSARYVPASTPMGDPIRMPSSVIIPLPYSALSNPPLMPGGGVISANKRQDMPAMPGDSRVHRIAAKQANPVMVATRDNKRKEQSFAFLPARRF